MVDVRRTKKVSELKPEDDVVQQFTQDSVGASDAFGLNLAGSSVAALYTKEDAFGINLKFATEYGYNSSAITKDNRNGLAAGVDAVIMPTSQLKVFASVGGSMWYGKDETSDPLVVGTKAGYSIPLNEDISLEPYVGADVGLFFKDGGGLDPVQFEAAAGVTMRWPGLGGWYTDYILNDEGRVFPGMSLGYSAFGNSDEPSDLNHSVKFTLFEPKGDEGMFYKLGGEAIVDATKLGTEDWQLLGTLYVDYEIPGFAGLRGSLVPWTIICYDNVADGSGGRENAVKLDVGANLENVISNTTLGIAWNTGNLLADDPVLGYLKLIAEIRF